MCSLSVCRIHIPYSDSFSIEARSLISGPPHLSRLTKTKAWQLMFRKLGYSNLINLNFARFFHKISKTDRRDFMMTKFGPPVKRDMIELDRSFFNKTIPLVVAYFPEPRYLGQFVKMCKKDILNLPSIKHIVHITPEKKGVILREDIESSEQAKEKLSQLANEKISEFGVILEPYNLELDYDFWKADDILRSVLPKELEDDIPTGFAQAGHVAHLNLRDEFKQYGKLIGQVIIDKNSKVETVVDKVDTIDTKFRTFKMNVLAGRDDLVVEQSESGCKFKFDFSKVYWNSRLNSEHERLINQFQPREVVGDVFAGVGPFAVPAGKKNVLVLANDLNPESYKYLNENIAINKVGDFVKSYHIDGREFIRKSPELLLDWANTAKTVERKKLVKRRKVEPTSKSGSNPADREYEITKVDIPKYFSNYVMNLPDSALTFLDEYIGLYSRNPEVKKVVKSLPDFKLPVINVHCFEKFSPDELPEPSMEELHKRVHAKVVKLLQCDLPFESCKFHLVRKVAPTKPMFCLSFELPEEVAFREV